MNRRALVFAVAACGLLATATPSLAEAAPAASNCDECRAQCNMIPMATEDCLELYCPECAGSVTIGTSPTSSPANCGLDALQVLAEDPRMPGGDAQQGERGAFRMPSTLLPVAEGSR